MKSRTVERSRACERKGLGRSKQGTDLGEEADLGSFKL